MTCDPLNGAQHVGVERGVNEVGRAQNVAGGNFLRALIVDRPIRDRPIEKANLAS